MRHTLTMGFRFSRRIKVAPGIRLNVSKSGVSTSVGRKGAWLTFGFDEHLGVAAKIATDGVIAVMGRELGLGEKDALALASVGVDLRVTQVVNGQVGVHAVLADDTFR